MGWGWHRRDRVCYCEQRVSEQILILGGVAAGLSAASRARRVAPGARITVLERGPVASYGACGLPAFLAGDIPVQEQLIAHSTDFFRDQRNIEVLTGHEALEILPARRRVRVRAGGSEHWLSYDRLVIATGARARCHLPGERLLGVHQANTWEQARALQAAIGEALARARAPRAAVIGAGYIGLEVAEALRKRGLEVVLLERHTQLLGGVDPEMAALLEPALAAARIEWRPGCAVEAIEGDGSGRVRAVGTRSGSLPADLVVNCGGLEPEVTLAAAAGLALGSTGAIAVDERQQTSQAGIYAAGDCAQTRHLVTGGPAWIPLATGAAKQGRVAGQNAAGGPLARFPGVLGSLAVAVFGREVGRTGLSREQARLAGFDVAAEQVESAAQAGYSGSRRLTLRLLYQPSSRRLLGCQMIGDPGTVAHRLDAAAVAITAGMNLEQIEQSMRHALCTGHLSAKEPA